MTGKTHKAIGTAVGVGMVIYGVSTNQPLYALGMVTAPFGAMLPDIDHCNTDLGKANKKIFQIIRIVAIVGLLLSFLVGGILITTGSAGNSLQFFLIIPVCLLVLAVTSTGFKKKFPFLTKHRGIMHTLVVPVCLLIGAASSSIATVEALLIGGALGYISHLVADCMTVAGCPICFPFSKECIVHGFIKTGTSMEYIGGVILSIAIIYYAYVLGTGSSSFDLVIYAIVFLISYGIGYQLVKHVKGKKLSKVAKCIAVVFLVGSVAIAIFMESVRGYAISCMLGVGMSFLVKGKHHGSK